MITSQGERALQGISKRVYGKRFSPEMLVANQAEKEVKVTGRVSKKDKNKDQTSLF